MDEQEQKRMLTENRTFRPSEERYKRMTYRRAGRSGLLLSEVSLGLWHNFGSVDSYENMRNMVFTAFDSGVTVFDIANNYGPVVGSAERNFGSILSRDLSAYRDEMIVTTKAGFPYWKGPYGDGGGLKYLVASLDRSLKNLGLDYVDVFYHHRPDPDTPLEETAYALRRIAESGKALYIGISNYGAPLAEKMCALLRAEKCRSCSTRCRIPSSSAPANVKGSFALRKNRAFPSRRTARWRRGF